MKIKMLLSLIFALFLIGNVNAIVTYGSWDDESAVKIANYGEVLAFNAKYFSINPPMTISIKLYDSNYNLEYTYLNNKVVDNYEYAKTFYLDTTILENENANYEIVFNGADNVNSDAHSIYLALRGIAENHAPVIISEPVREVDEKDLYAYQVIAQDVDGDELSYSLGEHPEWLTINSEGLISGVSPEVSWNTIYPVEVLVSDGIEVVRQEYTLEVIDRVSENHAPYFTSEPVTEVDELAYYFYSPKVFDEDEDYLTISAVELPSWLSMGAYGILYGVAPEVSQDTFYAVSIEVSDGVESALQNFSIKVIDTTQPENHAPIITSQPVTSVNEKTEYSYQIAAYDEDGDQLTYELISSPSWLFIDVHGLISGVAPEVSEDTSYLVSVRVSDNQDSTYQNFEVRVIDVSVNENHAPVIISDPITEINEGEEYNYQVVAQDVDGDDLMYSLNYRPTWLIIDSEGLISGVAPEVSQDTLYTVSVSAYDGEDTAIQTYILKVKDVGANDTTAPVITIISPKERTYRHENILFKIETDESAEAWFILDGRSYDLEEVEDKVFRKRLDLENGRYTVTFYAQDNAGNVGSKSVDFRVRIKDDDDDDNDDRMYWVYGAPLKSRDTKRPPIYDGGNANLPVIPKEEESEIDYWFWLLILLLLLGIIILLILIKKLREQSQGRNISQTQSPDYAQYSY